MKKSAAGDFKNGVGEPKSILAKSILAKKYIIYSGQIFINLGSPGEPKCRNSRRSGTLIKVVSITLTTEEETIINTNRSARWKNQHAGISCVFLHMND